MAPVRRSGQRREADAAVDADVVGNLEWLAAQREGGRIETLRQQLILAREEQVSRRGVDSGRGGIEQTGAARSHRCWRHTHLGRSPSRARKK